MGVLHRLAPGRALAPDRRSVRVLDNFATGRREDLPWFLAVSRWWRAILQSYQRAVVAVRDVGPCPPPSARFLRFSVRPGSADDDATNVIGTLNILLAAGTAASRVSCLPPLRRVPADRTLPKVEELSPEPISPYAVTKLAGEGYSRSFYHLYRLKSSLCNLRHLRSAPGSPSSR